MQKVPYTGPAVDCLVIDINHGVDFFPRGITLKFCPDLRLRLHKALKHSAVAKILNIKILRCALVIQIRIGEHIANALFQKGFV